MKNITAILLILLGIFLVAANYPEEEILNSINDIRNEYGLPILTHNWEIARIARYKTEDMKAKQYFDHHSPTYGSFFDTLENFSILYQTAGENIASGFTMPSTVIEAWMASEDHRINILNPNFCQAGVAYTGDGKSHYWAVIFLEVEEK